MPTSMNETNVISKQQIIDRKIVLQFVVQTDFIHMIFICIFQLNEYVG